MNYTNKGHNSDRNANEKNNNRQKETKRMPKRKCHLSVEQHVSETYRNSCYNNLCYHLWFALAVPLPDPDPLVALGTSQSQLTIVKICQKCESSFHFAFKNSAGKSASVLIFTGKFISPAVCRTEATFESCVCCYFRKTSQQISVNGNTIARCCVFANSVRKSIWKEKTEIHKI